MRQIVGSSERGDTIIEVLIAFAIFASVVVGSILVMNQGVAAAQRSLEITQVRYQIDGQAELLRAINKSYTDRFQRGKPMSGDDLWLQLKDSAHAVSQAQDIKVINGVCDATRPQNAFFVAVDAGSGAIKLGSNSNVVMSSDPSGTLPPYSQIDMASTTSKAYGIWVQSVPSDTNEAVPFVDFHIKACWSAPGSNAPVTIGTIVRLYEPK